MQHRRSALPLRLGRRTRLHSGAGALLLSTALLAVPGTPAVCAQAADRLTIAHRGDIPHRANVVGYSRTLTGPGLSGTNRAALTLNTRDQAAGSAGDDASLHRDFPPKQGVMHEISHSAPSNSGLPLQSAEAIHEQGRISALGLHPGARRASLPGPVGRPDDPQYGQQWALTALGATNAWATSTGDSNVVVAVIHTGIRYDHEDLADNMWRNPGEIPGNGLDDDGNGYVDDIHGIDLVDSDSDPMDPGLSNGNYLGTTTAGVIGAVGNNGKGIAGVNWRVRLMAVRIINPENSTRADFMTKAFRYVLTMRERGINLRVVNLAVVGPTPEAAHLELLRALGDHGVLVVTLPLPQADNDASPGYPACYPLPNVLSVAATDRADRLAAFSAWGRTNVDLAAPSVAIRTTSGGSPTDYVTAAENGRTWLAIAHVSGAAALLASAWPDATLEQIRTALLISVDLVPALTNRVVSHGRLNVGRAMDHLRKSMTSSPDSFVLRISRSNEGVVLCWPLTAGAAVVERTLALPSSAGTWSPVHGLPTTNGTSICITLPVGGDSFFRLRRP